MSIMVTGAAGFIGRHLCRKLNSQGHELVMVDDFTSSDPCVREELEGYGKFVRIGIEDITMRYPIHGSMDITQVYNLACPASPPEYQADPIRTMMTCVVGVSALFDYFMGYGIPIRFLQASTSEIYGDPLVHPQIESYRGNVNTTGPRACYDEGKRAAEALVYDYQRLHPDKVDVRVARIFNTYGPGMMLEDGRVITNFIKQVLADEPLTVYGDGTQTRSFCYISDMVDGLIALMESDYRDPVNLGNPREFTVLEAAKMAIWTHGSGSIEYRSLPQDDPTRRKPDITRAREVLGWVPKVKFEDGFKMTYDHFASMKGLIDG